MTDYTIEDVDRYLRNNMGEEDYALYSGAIEALQALVEKQKADNLKMVGIINELEAKLAAQPPTALELMKSYSDGKQWALEEAAQLFPQPNMEYFGDHIQKAIRNLVG